MIRSSLFSMMIRGSLIGSQFSMIRSSLIGSQFSMIRSTFIKFTILND